MRTQWPQRHDLHEVGFELRTEKSRYVECIICRRSGGGRLIRGEWVWGIVRELYGWQLDCLRPHTFECACGLFFPKSLALASHVAQNRRHEIPGHGRMDQVSWEPVGLRKLLGRRTP